MAMKPRKLQVIHDCEGCGVCCLHMGFPAFLLPREPYDKEQIENDPKCKELLDRGWTEDELLSGSDGESHWRRLPGQLREEWIEFTSSYQKSGEIRWTMFLV